MLEFLLLRTIWTNLSKIAADKGRSRGWAFVSIGFWVGGEIAGFVIGSLLGFELGAYAVALALAALGATVGWFVVKALPPLDTGDFPSP